MTVYVPPPDWREKIAVAKAARELGRTLREGKPSSFYPMVGARRDRRGYGSGWR